MTRPSSSPRGEHAPRPGITWEARLVSVEEVVDDTAVPDMDQPLPPRPNRATRRALARAARRTK